MQELSSSKLFLSHSFQDKDRVRPLAQRLMNQGIDVWLDEWEMGLGDSLVQKIEQGLQESGFFLIVISQNSIASKWVREELSSAVVSRIQEKMTIIPVRLDQTPLPQLINHLYYVQLEPVDNAVREIVRKVFGVSGKPVIGNIPMFIQHGHAQQAATISGLSADASLLLRLIVKQSKSTDNPWWCLLDTDRLQSELQMEDTRFEDALDILLERRLIRSLRESGPGFVRPTPHAWIYAADVLDYALRPVMQQIAVTIVAAKEIDGEMLEQQTGLPTYQIREAVGILDALGRIELYAGGMGAGRPYGFVTVKSTRKTREWVDMQGH